MSPLQIARLCHDYGLTEGQARLLAPLIFGEGQHD